MTKLPTFSAACEAMYYKHSANATQALQTAEFTFAESGENRQAEARPTQEPVSL
jgi:hypothetical protein